MGGRIAIDGELTVGTGEPGLEDLARLRDDGFRSVVDLRTEAEEHHGPAPAEEGEEVRRLGLTYCHLPVPTGELDGTALASFDEALGRLPKPVFVHCASGKRSGSFAMAHAAVREGLSGEEALRRAERLGVLYGSAAVRDALRRHVDRRMARRRGGDRVGSGGSRAEADGRSTFLPATATRVTRHTDEEINRRIAAQIERNVRFFAERPEHIDRRLRELDAEWDIERTLEANAATLALGGTLLGIFADRRFLALPVAVTAFLLQHALQGWCPPVPFFRKRGVRTAEEINRERTALKALRGDFGPLEQVAGDGAGPRAEAALRAAAA
jgi:uncharacterized protein (TIGR01244 family)